MSALVATVVIASLFGSLHCAGMCGPLVAFYAGGARHVSHVVYNLGRLVSYATLGALAGALGSALDRVVSLTGLQRGSAVVAAVVLLVWALAPYLPVRWKQRGQNGVIGRFVGTALGRLSRLPATARALMVGVLSALLPCGWLYAFVAAAAGTGHAAYGALVMTAFWVGTVPVLLATGYGMSSFAHLLRNRRGWITALLLLSLGTVTLVGRVDLIGLEIPAAATSVEQATDNVRASGDEEPSCCH